MDDLDVFESAINEEVLPAPGKSNTVAQNLIIRPEVARMLASGMSEQEVCIELGVTARQLRRCIKTLDFTALLEIENRRIIRHLSKRDLSKEKYLQIATAMGLMVDKMRLLRNEPTTIPGGQSTTIIENLTIGLFGRGGGQGPPDDRQIEGEGAITIPAICDGTPEEREGATEPDNMVPGVAGQQQES